MQQSVCHWQSQALAVTVNIGVFGGRLGSSDTWEMVLDAADRGPVPDQTGRPATASGQQQPGARESNSSMAAGAIPHRIFEEEIIMRFTTRLALFGAPCLLFIFALGASLWGLARMQGDFNPLHPYRAGRGHGLQGYARGCKAGKP